METITRQAHQIFNGLVKDVYLDKEETIHVVMQPQGKELIFTKEEWSRLIEMLKGVRL